MANPAFRNSDVFEGGPRTVSPAVTADVMTYENTFQKIFIVFLVLLAGAGVGWVVPALLLPAAAAGFVLALVNIFRRTPSPALILTYAAAEGVLVGAVSAFYEGMWDGIVVQALFGVLGVVGVTLVLFLNGKVRSSPRATKIFLVAMVGYLVFSLVNMGLMLTGVTDSMFGLRGYMFLGMPLGMVLGVLIVLMAAYSLVIDFEQVQAGVVNRAPRVFGWQAAFGIAVTIVWLYLEILRMIALSRR